MYQLSIKPEHVISIYKKYGFNPTFEDFGQASTKTLHPLVAVAYDLIEEKKADNSISDALKEGYNELQLSDVINSISSNCLEGTEFIFGFSLSPEYWDGFVLGLLGRELPSDEYARFHLGSTSRLKTLLDDDITGFIEVYEQAVKESQATKKALLMAGIAKHA